MDQVTNPITAFAHGNNLVVLDKPALHSPITKTTSLSLFNDMRLTQDISGEMGEVLYNSRNDVT